MKTLRSFSIAALALASMPAAAQPDVQLYGVIDAMAYRKELAGEPSVVRIDSGGTTTSFWGLRGSEDLGGGLRAEFDLSSFFRGDVGGTGRTDTDTFFARSSWVGLRGNWGALRLGRQSTLAFVNMQRYSAFGASSVFGPSFLHNYQASATQPMMTASGAADSGWNNVVSYATPNFSGLTGAFFYAPSESTTAGKRMGANLTYTRGDFSAGLALERIRGMDLNFSKPPAVVRMTDSDVVSLGASYDFKAVKLFGQVIRTELNNTTTEIDLSSYNVGVTAPLGAGRVMASYGATTKSQSAQADQKRKTFSLGYEHYLSKRTNLYGVVMNDRATALSSGTGFAAGIRHQF